MRRIVFRTLALVVVLAATPAARAQQAAEVVVERDLVYGKGSDTELQLDLAMPKNGAGRFPAIVCIHGGGWVSGNRQDLTKSVEILAGRGYVAVTISYRLAPAARFPAQIEDCKAAVRWLRAHAREDKINPERIGVVGYSAGAHLACLLGTTDKNDGLEGAGGNPEQSSRVQAVVSFFGPTDLTRKDWTKEAEEKFLVPFLGGKIADKPDLYR